MSGLTQVVCSSRDQVFNAYGLLWSIVVRLLLIAPPVHATTRCVHAVAIFFISFFLPVFLFLAANFMGKTILFEDAFVELQQL